MESQSAMHITRRSHIIYAASNSATPNYAQSVRLRKAAYNSCASNSVSRNVESAGHGLYRRSFKRFQPQYQSGTHDAGTTGKDSRLKTIAGVCLFVFALSIYYFYGDLLTFGALKQNHHAIIAYIAQKPMLSPLIFVVFECVVVGLTIPGATVLSMAAGTRFSLLCVHETH